jgi:CubicO group peptidase (beta-lactamase class C family)
MRHPVFHWLSVVAFVFGSTPPTHAQVLAPPDPFSPLDRGLRPDVAPAGGALPRWSLGERMHHYRVPGVAIAILRNGVVQAAGYGVRQAGMRDAVDGDTLFSVGSISKVVTAATILRLVARGQLDLDRNVGAYLKRWRLPPSAAVPEPKVSLRMLMTHSAGFGVHGFADYQPHELLPTLVQVLDGSGPAKNEAVRFKHVPGLRSDYSGGGVTVEQMTIEDATGRPLAELAGDEVFAPLGMRRSTFESPLSAASGNIARAHDARGAPTALPRGWESFAESGASGLWTSASDLGRFLGGLIKSYQGRTGFLPLSLATAMMTRVSPGVFGLGPRLGGSGTGRHFYHMGANQSYLSFIEGYPETGEGFVILTNGGNGGGLVAEVRNALADAIGQGAHAELRGVALRTPPSPDLRGKYRLDAAVPLALRGALTDNFEYDSVEIDVVGEAVRIALPGQETPAPLIALGPEQFALPGLYTFVLEFSRDSFGAVRGVTISMPDAASMAYYARE